MTIFLKLRSSFLKAMYWLSKALSTGPSFSKRELSKMDQFCKFLNSLENSVENGFWAIENYFWQFVKNTRRVSSTITELIEKCCRKRAKELSKVIQFKLCFVHAEYPFSKATYIAFKNGLAFLILFKTWFKLILTL